jgi:hypothetical protein
MSPSREEEFPQGLNDPGIQRDVDDARQTADTINRLRDLGQRLHGAAQERYPGGYIPPYENTDDRVMTREQFDELEVVGLDTDQQIRAIVVQAIARVYAGKAFVERARFDEYTQMFEDYIRGEESDG